MFNTWATLANGRRKNAPQHKFKIARAWPRCGRLRSRITGLPPGPECFMSRSIPPGIGRIRQFLRFSLRDWLGGDEGRDAAGGGEGAGWGRDTVGGGE